MEDVSNLRRIHGWSACTRGVPTKTVALWCIATPLSANFAAGSAANQWASPHHLRTGGVVRGDALRIRCQGFAFLRVSVQQMLWCRRAPCCQEDQHLETGCWSGRFLPSELAQWPWPTFPTPRSQRVCAYVEGIVFWLLYLGMRTMHGCMFGLRSLEADRLQKAGFDEKFCGQPDSCD